MAISVGKLSAVCFEAAHARGAGRVCVYSERAGLVVDSSGQTWGRRCSGKLVLAGVSREGRVLKGLAGGGRRATRVAGLVSDSLPLAEEKRETEEGGRNPTEVQSSVHSKKGEGNGGIAEVEDDSGEEEDVESANPAPWMSEEEAKAVVSEVILNGDDLTVIEYPGKEDAQRDDVHPLNSLADSLLNKTNTDGRNFSLTDVGGLLKTGKHAGELNVPDLSVSGFAEKEGVSLLAQWTSTELTMQHAQLARLVTDVFYMQLAFAFFGGVRIVEALVNVYSTSPPDFSKVKECLNALDPLTISWLAYNVRDPLAKLMEADPMDLEKVISLKSSLWQALHAFYERQWKVMGTLAMARSLALITSHELIAGAVTDKLQWFWNALMALPVF